MLAKYLPFPIPADEPSIYSRNFIEEAGFHLSYSIGPTHVPSILIVCEQTSEDTSRYSDVNKGRIFTENILISDCT